MRAVLLMLLIALSPLPVFAADLPGGMVQFLTTCPGDLITTAKPEKADEGLFAAILTPLLAGTINAGLKAWGAKLKEASQEQQVDTLHAGD